MPIVAFSDWQSLYAATRNLITRGELVTRPQILLVTYRGLRPDTRRPWDARHGFANTVPRHAKYPRNLVPAHRRGYCLGRGKDFASATRTKSVTFGQRKRHECIFMGINHATIKSPSIRVIWKKKIKKITRLVFAMREWRRQRMERTAR